VGKETSKISFTRRTRRNRKTTRRYKRISKKRVYKIPFLSAIIIVVIRMRLDKFLKVSRIIKRRSLAKEVADNKRIQVNGKIAKSSTKLEVGDTITITFGNKIVEVKVKQLLDSTKKEDASLMFEIIQETYVEQGE
jgi:ribosomal 50S subunit-recycling heat shock protein